MVDGVPPVVEEDEVTKEGHRVAMVDLAVDDEGGRLLLPHSSQTMCLIPRDEDCVPKQVVDRMHEAIILHEGHPAPLFEEELSPAEDLARVVHLAIGVPVDVARQVALPLIERFNVLVLLHEVDATTHSRTGAAPGPCAPAG